MRSSESFDLLLSLPPNMCEHLSDCEPAVAQRAFSTFDPPGQQLGSGGGAAYVLEQAWRASGVESFPKWLEQSGKLIIHGGGESRRLSPMPMPRCAYASGWKGIRPTMERALSISRFQNPDCR